MFDQQLFTRSEAAAYMRLSPQTLATWASRGVGPTFLRVGRAVRYRLSDLNVYLDDRVVTAEPEQQQVAMA